MYVLFCTCKDLTIEPITCITLYVYNINVPRVYYVFCFFFVFFCLEKINAIELAQLRY